MNATRLSKVSGWWFCFVLPVKTCSRRFVSIILTFLVDRRHVLVNLPSLFTILLNLSLIAEEKENIDKLLSGLSRTAAEDVDSTWVGFFHLVSVIPSYVPLLSVVGS